MDITAGMHPETILIANTAATGRTLFDLGWRKIFHVNATGIALGCFGKNIPNTAMLGAIARSGIIALTAVEQSIRYLLHKDIVEANIKAAREAYEKTKIH
jgi:Pyruvate/2-oxoacid:ferredoxin oxidoreductase gamma subunit